MNSQLFNLGSPANSESLSADVTSLASIRLKGGCQPWVLENFLFPLNFLGTCEMWNRIYLYVVVVLVHVLKRRQEINFLSFNCRVGTKQSFLWYITLPTLPNPQIFTPPACIYIDYFSRAWMGMQIIDLIRKFTLSKLSIKWSLSDPCKA